MSTEGKKDTPEQAEFRKYCRDWLSENVPAPPSFRLPQSAMEIMTQQQMDYLASWQKSAISSSVAESIPCSSGVQVRNPSVGQ